MTLPVSSYEELLARVRSLTSETIQLRREISSSLSDHPVLGSVELPAGTDNDYHMIKHATLVQRGTSTGEDLNTANAPDFGTSLGSPDRSAVFFDKKENEIDNEFKEIDEKLTSPCSPIGKNCFQRNGWAPDSLGLWRSGPSSLNLEEPCNNYSLQQDLTSSVNYNSNEPQSLNTLSSSKRIYSHQQLGAKVEMVYSLLSMLDMNNREDMSKTFLAMSSSPESCHAMRQSGCLPLLIQLIHSSELNREVRERAAEALHNIVHSQTDEKRRKREVRVLKLLQQIREYCDELKNNYSQESLQLQEPEKHPINAIGTLMKFSFDAEHRQAICILGGLHAISELIQIDYEAHGDTTGESLCITLRRYAGMSLTNLTFGDCKNKSLLCSFNKFMHALVNQLKSPCEDLRQVTASVLRNLSWRADSESKQALRDVGAVTALTVSAMEGKKESTLKSILSALWNLSAHCSLNKVDICSVPGALAFLVKMLKYKSLSNTLAIVENAGGILRNISSHIAVREDYRQILRENNCFEILLEQLKSPSLTVVSNACGTLWNLSARCTEDQRRLWEMGATSMLRSLVQSKHKMISMGSSAALKNLLAANPNENLLTHLDSTAKSLGLQNLPTLFVRKKRALEQELNITLAETCDNIDSVESPTHFTGKTEMKKVSGPKRSESRDSVQSTQSDSTYERINQMSLKNEEKLLENKNVTLHDSLDEKSTPRKLEDQKLIKRYNKSSMIPTPTFKKVNQDRINEKTREEHTQGNIASEADIKKVNDIKKEVNRESKAELKDEVSATNTKPENLKILNNQCSSLNNSFPTSAIEYFVNCNENESLQRVENIEKHNTNLGNPVINSPLCKKQVTPDFDCERNTRVKSKCAVHSNIQNGFVVIGKSERLQEKKEHEILGTSRNHVLETCLPSTLNVAKCVTSPGTACIPQEFDEKVNENVSKREIPECTSFEASNESERSPSKFREKSSQRDLPMDFLPKNFISEDRRQNIIQKPLPALCPELPSSGQCSKINPKEFGLMIESNKIIKSEENKSFFFNEKPKPSGEQSELHETPQTARMAVQENGYETSGEESHVLLGSPKSSHQSSGQSSPSLNLEGRNNQNQKLALDVMDFPEAAAGEHKYTNFSSADFDGVINMTDVFEPNSTEINIPHSDFAENVSKSTFNSGDESDVLRVESIDSVHLKSLSNIVLPKFKVGSPMTDAKVLQVEANKICREIKKHQDFEMGCSLTSEVSLVSCSSFIDPGDFSLFDSSTDAADLDVTENMDFGKGSSKFKNVPLRRPMTCQNIESVSLPSLGSLKNEQIEALDLDSSILSVASITSEIAETYSKDFENFQTYTKTYKIDARDEPRDEFHDDTVADVTLVFNEDDTLDADSLQNNPEFFDEDNSLYSQENLPLDTENLEESSSDRPKKKLTPKEKRRTFHERYRTYTIRDINGCKSSEIPSAATSQGVEVTLKKDEVSVSCAQGDQHEHTGVTFGGNNCVRRIGNGEINGGKEKLDCHSQILCNNRKQEVFFISKELAEAEISDLVRTRLSIESSDVMNIGPAERKELVDNAKLVAFSLKTAVHDYEMISDSETEDPHVDFDTATYSKNFRDHRRYMSSPQVFQEQDKRCLQEDEVPLQDEDPEKKGARILKPNKKSDEKLEETPKGIRGRRKPLYSSPQKHSRRTTGSPVNLPKTSHMVTDAKKSLSDNFVTPILHREGTFTKQDGPTLKKSENKNTRTIPVLCRNAEPKNVSSAKAVSGNKSALSSASPKRNGENQVSKIGRPMSTYGTKVSEKRLESDYSQRRSFSADAGNKIGGDVTITTKKFTPTGLTSPKMRNPSSNQNLKAGNSPGSGFTTSKTTLQNLKSQSDANLNLATYKDKGKQKTPRKEVTSKIASLWRKVEETKQKNETSKDNRVWISSEKNTTVGDEVLVVEQEEILDIPTRRIVHSLTCQALTDEVSIETTPQERNSRTIQEFSQYGGSGGKNERIERRNIISAVVPPYNYSPPISEKTTPLKIKQVDTFHKGSLKVTTV